MCKAVAKQGEALCLPPPPLGLSLAPRDINFGEAFHPREGRKSRGSELLCGLTEKVARIPMQLPEERFALVKRCRGKGKKKAIPLCLGVAHRGGIDPACIFCLEFPPA